MAFLDLFPDRKGMTLVIPKKHYDSDIFKMEAEIYSRYMLAVKEVANFLKKWCNVDMVGVMVIGLEILHAHVRLYPFYPDKSFDHIPNGPQANIGELQKIADDIIKNNQD